MKHATTFTSLAISCCFLAACDDKPGVSHDKAADESKPTAQHDKAVRIGQPSVSQNAREAGARIAPAQGLKLEGEIDLKEVGGGVEIVAKIENASPGMHGFHIHEKGDCSDIVGKSMGGHFNPGGKPHMLPLEGDDRHLGDLGNIEVGDDGKGKVTFSVKGASLQEGELHSLLGKSFVIHERQDSGQKEQPAGDSGTPIGCGVIKTD